MLKSGFTVNFKIHYAQDILIKLLNLLKIINNPPSKALKKCSSKLDIHVT